MLSKSSKGEGGLAVAGRFRGADGGADQATPRGRVLAFIRGSPPAGRRAAGRARPTARPQPKRKISLTEAPRTRRESAPPPPISILPPSVSGAAAGVGGGRGSFFFGFGKALIGTYADVVPGPRVIICCWLFCVPPAVGAAEYWVDQRHPAAADSNAGVAGQPWLTLGRACATARAGDVVHIRPGIYREALIPQHSGEEGRPIVFVGEPGADGSRPSIRGSRTITGFEAEGGNRWLFRHWVLSFPDVSELAGISDAPRQDSARYEQVFVDGQPLQWVPSRRELQPGCFYWHPAVVGGELVIQAPAGVEDLNRSLVEVPVLPQVVGAWPEEMPRGLAEVRWLRATNPGHPWLAQRLPGSHHIQITGLHFAHAAHTANRGGVRLDGDDWLLEDCAVESMNCLGVLAGGDRGIVRRCRLSNNGQAAAGVGRGDSNVFEEVVAMHNNRKRFKTEWGGAGIKLCWGTRSVVRRSVCAFNWGSGIWFDEHADGGLIEGCVVIGNREANGAIFCEISADGTIRDNVTFGARSPVNPRVFGAGCVLYVAANCLVADNVFLGGDGGIACGSSRPLPRADGGTDLMVTAANTVARNLVVAPRLFALSLLANARHDAATPAARNTVTANTVVAGSGTGRVNHGDRTLPDVAALAAAAGAGFANRGVARIEDLADEERRRLDWACGRIVGALLQIEPALFGGRGENVDGKVGDVELREIIPLPGGNAGYRLAVGGRQCLLLDIASPGPLAIPDFGAKSAALIDFPPLQPARRVPLDFSGGAVRCPADGPFAVVVYP